MVLYDANDIKTLVTNQWSLNTFTASSTNPVNGGPLTFNENLATIASSPNQVINPSFESGSTGWSLSGASVSTGEAHTGTHSLNFNQSNQATQNFTGIPVSSITSPITYWTYPTDSSCSIFFKVSYSDSTSQTFGGLLSSPNSWTQQSISVGSLSAGKTITSIEIFSGASSDPVYVDDVAINFNIPVGLRLQIDEYDPMHPEYQIVVLNRPERVTPVAPNVIKHSQVVGVEFYMKLNNYLPDDIENVWRPLILAAKNELTRIMNTYRFNGIGYGTGIGDSTYAVTINHSDWKDSKFPHGFAGDVDPINFVSTMSIELVWYESLNGDEIGMRVTALDLFPNSEAYPTNGGGPLLGLLDVTWEDTDPSVKLQVPKGPLLEQHLVGPHVEGKITCHDWHSLYTLLYNTPIPENPSYKPINTDNSKTVFSTNPANPEFLVYIQDNYGKVDSFQFTNVRIQKIRFSRGSVLGLDPLNWEISFMADYLYPVPPIN